MEQPHCVLVRVIRAERIGAHKLGKAIGLVRIGCEMWPHFVQYDRHPSLHGLPSRFRASHAGADDVDMIGHFG